MCDSKSPRIMEAYENNGKRKGHPNVLVDIFMFFLSSVIRALGLVWFAAGVFVSLFLGSQKRRESLKVIQRNVLVCKEDPAGTMKKAIKILWCIGVLLTILNMLGFSANPISHLSVASDMFRSSEVPVVTDDAPKEEEENLEQNLGPGKKKMTKKREREFACEEVNCIETCARKVTKKCMNSASCLQHRAKECKKKCRKARCEARCKEDGMSYVERTTKLETCKEACKAPKCEAKCETEFMPCKNKCKFLHNKYKCDREPELPVARTPDAPGGDASLESSGSASSLSISTEDLGEEI